MIAAVRVSPFYWPLHSHTFGSGKCHQLEQHSQRRSSSIFFRLAENQLGNEQAWNDVEEQDGETNIYTHEHTKILIDKQEYRNTGKRKNRQVSR